jgi:hypothetical protein
MQIRYKVNEKMVVVVEGDTLLDTFSKLSDAQQVFSVEKCGCCGSTEIKFVLRKATSGKKEFNYPEVWCEKCRARLSYGQSEGGTIYPKTKWSQLMSDSDKEQWAEAKEYADKHAGYLPHNGWYKYVKKD